MYMKWQRYIEFKRILPSSFSSSVYRVIAISVFGVLSSYSFFIIVNYTIIPENNILLPLTISTSQFPLIPAFAEKTETKYDIAIGVSQQALNMMLNGIYKLFHDDFSSGSINVHENNISKIDYTLTSPPLLILNTTGRVALIKY